MYLYDFVMELAPIKIATFQKTNYFIKSRLRHIIL
jgi:hypothetical protein